jgi:hypothetical protein
LPLNLLRDVRHIGLPLKGLRSPSWLAGIVSPQAQQEMAMTKFKNSDRNDQFALIEDAQLDAVVGGALNIPLSPQLALASLQVGPVMRDLWGPLPTLGTYH